MARLTIVEARDLFEILSDTVGIIQDGDARADFMTQYTRDIPAQYWFANGGLGFILLFDPADGFSLIHESGETAPGRMQSKIEEANRQLNSN